MHWHNLVSIVSKGRIPFIFVILIRWCITNLRYKYSLF